MYKYSNCDLLLTGGKPMTTRHANPWWKEKAIDSELKRREGLCPLTPEEAALVLTALGIDHNVRIYIAAGEIYSQERRLRPLAAAFRNLVSNISRLFASLYWYSQILF